MKLHRFPWILVVAASLGGCATYDGLGYAVTYGGAVELKRPHPGTWVTSYPWQAGEDILITTCGFAEVVYNETPVLEPRESYQEQPKRRATYLAMTGEWCDMEHLLLERPHHRAEHLLLYRWWHGKRYLLLYTPVYQDAEGADYIGHSDFIDWAELKPLLRSVVQGDKNSGCFEPEGPELQSLQDTEDLVHVEDPYTPGTFCFNHGVYLRDIARALTVRERQQRGPAE
jgi:hypothetical protein